MGGRQPLLLVCPDRPPLPVGNGAKGRTEDRDVTTGSRSGEETSTGVVYEVFLGTLRGVVSTNVSYPSRHSRGSRYPLLSTLKSGSVRRTLMSCPDLSQISRSWDVRLCSESFHLCVRLHVPVSIFAYPELGQSVRLYTLTCVSGHKRV